MEPSDRERLVALETKQSSVEDDVGEIKLDVKGVWSVLDDVRGLLNRRPSWAVTAYVTAVSSACAALLAYVLSNAGK